MKKLSVSELLQVAELISDLPDTDFSKSPELIKWLGVEDVTYTKYGDNMVFKVYDPSTSKQYMKYTPVGLLKALGNYNAAVAFALTQEYHEYVDNVNSNCWVRCELLSAMLGFDSGHAEDDIDDYETFDDYIAGYTESEYGVFFGSRNNLKVVEEGSETIYEIARFLGEVIPNVGEV